MIRKAVRLIHDGRTGTENLKNLVCEMAKVVRVHAVCSARRGISEDLVLVPG